MCFWWKKKFIFQKENDLKEPHLQWPGAGFWAGGDSHFIPDEVRFLTSFQIADNLRHIGCGPADKWGSCTIAVRNVDVRSQGLPTHAGESLGCTAQACLLIWNKPIWTCWLEWGLAEEFEEVAACPLRVHEAKPYSRHPARNQLLILPAQVDLRILL